MVRTEHDPKSALAAARSPATPEAELRALAEAPWNFVREAVAVNPLTPSDVLAALLPQALMTKDDFRIALSLLQNPTGTRKLVGAIAPMAETAIPQFQPREYYPRRMFEALVSHPLADAEILGKFLDSTLCPNHLREWSAKLSVRPDVLHRLMSDRSERVRKRAALRLAQLTDQRRTQ